MMLSKVTKIATGITLTFGAILGSIDPASAYSYRTCNGNKLVYGSGWTNMYISTTSMPPGSSWDTALQNMMYEWNAVPRSRFNFYVGRDTDGRHSKSNGRNEVYFTSIDGRGGTLAVTYTRWSFCFFSSSIQETDIAFDSGESWYTGAPSYTSSSRSFRLVALHEFGHALGLGHEDRSLETMNSFYPNGGPIGRFRSAAPHADSRQGVRYLYPQSGSSVRDLAACNYKRTGSGTTGLNIQPTIAYRGRSVNLQYTFENLGTVTSNFNIGFYLSTNDYISTYDRLLGTNYGAWASAGYTGTFNRSLYIPTSVTPGTYYIGVLLDRSGTVAETNESNNNLAAVNRVVVR